MEEERVGRRRVPEIALHAQLEPGVAQAQRQVAGAEVVGAGVAQRLAGGGEEVDHGVALGGVDVLLEIADCLRRLAHRGAVAAHRARHQAAVGLDHRLGVGPGGAEIEQHEAAAGGVEAVVGEVGVGLDEAELEQLAEQQADQEARDAVAQRLVGGLRVGDGRPRVGDGRLRLCERLHRHALDPAHRQDVAARERIHRVRQHEVLRVAEQAAEAVQVLGLAAVVGLLVELALGLGEQRREVERLGQQAGDAQQGGDVVHVAVDAAAHARVLQLDRQLLAVAGARAMHLADRGRRARGEGEALEALLPALAPVRLQHLHHLAHRHGARVLAQAGEDLGELGRQQVAGVHRHQLPDLHRRAAQLRELVGDAAGVGRGEHQLAHLRALAGGELARALGEHAARHPGGEAAQAGEAGQAAARHRGAVCGVRDGVVRVDGAGGGVHGVFLGGRSGRARQLVRGLQYGHCTKAPAIRAMQATVVRRRRSGRYHPGRSATRARRRSCT